jgi:hypothetical protein
MKTFSAQVKDWVDRSEEAKEAIVKDSIQELFDLTLVPVSKGGNMPVDTGFLRNSFSVTQNQPDRRSLGNPGISPPLGDYAFIIAGMKMGTSIYGMFVANYARYVHYGTRGRKGRLFVDLAAQKWQSIVSASAKKLKVR